MGKNEADKAKVEYRHMLSKKSRELKSVGRSSESPTSKHTRSIVGSRSMSPINSKAHLNSQKKSPENTVDLRKSNTDNSQNGSKLFHQNHKTEESKHYPNTYVNEDLRRVDSRNSRLSKTMPKNGKNGEHPVHLREHSVSFEDMKDEGIQMSPLLTLNEAKPDTAETKDIGIQFTFEDVDDRNSNDQDQDEEVVTKTPVVAEEVKQPVRKPKSPLNIFADEQGAGQYKIASEPDENLVKNSEKTTEDAHKNTFDSRKTSQSKVVRLKDTDKNYNKENNTENTETKDDDKGIDTGRTGKFTDRTRKRYKDLENLALWLLKDWKDSKIFEWYIKATVPQQENLVEYLISRENFENRFEPPVLDYKELSYILNMLSKREHFTKKSLKTVKNADGSLSEAFIKFDGYNVNELFESLRRTIMFVYGLFGLEKYILLRVYGIYHTQDDQMSFVEPDQNSSSFGYTIENAKKLCIR